MGDPWDDDQDEEEIRRATQILSRPLGEDEVRTATQVLSRPLTDEWLLRQAQDERGATADGALLVMVDDDPERDVVALAAEVHRRIRTFDLIALVRVLREMSYAIEDIRFESVPRASSPAGLVEDIAFRDEPSPHVVVFVNLGLLGPQGTLPSYFLKAMDNRDFDADAFIRFVQFFEHLIIKNLLLAAYPARNTALFRDYEATKRGYLALLGLRSLSTIHWLAEAVYPELGVSVRRASAERQAAVGAPRLGATALGAGALGGVMRVPLPGVEITLVCENEDGATGRPWVEEARRRLKEDLLPVLAGTDLDLCVKLVIQTQRAWARLGPGSFLGFVPMKGGGADRRVIVLFRGRVRTSARPESPRGR